MIKLIIQFTCKFFILKEDQILKVDNIAQHNVTLILKLLYYD